MIGLATVIKNEIGNEVSTPAARLQTNSSEKLGTLIYAETCGMRTFSLHVVVQNRVTQGPAGVTSRSENFCGDFRARCQLCDIIQAAHRAVAFLGIFARRARWFHNERFSTRQPSASSSVELCARCTRPTREMFFCLSWRARSLKVLKPSSTSFVDLRV